MSTGSLTADTKQNIDVEMGKGVDKAHTAELRSKRRFFENKIRDMLSSAASNSKNAITREDANYWLRMMTDDDSLESGGATTEEKKLQYVEENVGHTRDFINEANNLSAEFITKITTAKEKGWISKNSADKWLNRLKQHSGSWLDTKAFIESFDANYVKNWERVAHDIKTVEGLAIVLGLTSKEIPELKRLKESGFLDKNYNERRDVVSRALAALTAHQKKNTATKKEAEKILDAAAAEEIISKHKIGPWLDHIVSGKRSISELKKYIKDWRAIRVKYDSIEEKLDGVARQPQGFNRISPHKFLLLTYEQRVSYVQEAEWRLKHHMNQPEDTAIEDFKGKIRHALDTEDWEDADYYLEKARAIAMKPQDINELHSLERNLEQFRTRKKKEEGPLSETARLEIKRANEEIAAAVDQLPTPAMKRAYRKALALGAEATRCLGKTVYNVKWCKDRNYLNEEIVNNSRARAAEETANRLRASGEGHKSGKENNRVDGYYKKAIRDEGLGPQNLFIGEDGVDAFMEKVDQNKDTYSFWYWTNAIFDGVSMEQYEMVASVLNPVFRRNTRILQKYGMTYTGHHFSMN